MKLFRIEISVLDNNEKGVGHKVFINDREELEFRRSMDEKVKGRFIKGYNVSELDVNNIQDISELKGLSLLDLKKIVLHRDESYKNIENNNKQENEYNEVDILKELQKIKKDDNTIYRCCGHNGFRVLNELIISKHIDKIYLSRQAVIDIIENSTDIKMDADTLLRYCQISETTSNKDIADLWYSINCGFNFSNKHYYAYGFKIPFVIDDRLHENSIIGINNDRIVALNNVTNEYLKILGVE